MFYPLHVFVFLCFLFIPALASQNLEENEYVIDRSHSSVAFGIKHLSVADTIGVFEEFDGKLIFSNGTIQSLQGSVDIKSVNTFNKARDEDLQDSKFFSQKEAFLESISVDKGKMRAYLTINGVKKEVLFSVKTMGPIVNPSLKQNQASFILKNPLLANGKNPQNSLFMNGNKPSDSDCACYKSYGEKVLGLELNGVINRFDFNVAGDTPGELLGSSVWIRIIIEASR